MKTKLYYLATIIFLFFSCIKTEKKQSNSKLPLTVFDSIAPAIKTNFQRGDSLQGYIWATSKVYVDGETPCRDRFEGFFKCLIK
jgi:hypothetical protein